MSPKAVLGVPAPDFELPDFQGRPFRLSDQRGQSAVVLVFNRGFT
jgi:peroxiredoxin